MRRSHIRAVLVKQDIARSIAKAQRHQDNVCRTLGIMLQGGWWPWYQHMMSGFWYLEDSGKLTFNAYPTAIIKEGPAHLHG